MNGNCNADEIVKTYADNIFGFCISRLNNIDDAQDLSQEILFEILRSLSKNNISDMNAWVWKIAYNRYARRINDKNKQKYVIMSLDDRNVLDILADDRDILEEDNSDETNAVFSAVHSLAKSHRDILVDYYVYELSYSEIAEKHKLSANTVKTRLFYGRQKLKERWQTIMNENKIYEEINWSLGCNGNIGTERYLNRQICRAITKAAYEKPLTITEISAATGIPCLYIEDEIPNLLYGEALTEEKGKYSTNFIIHSKEFMKKIVDLLKKADVGLSDKLVQILDKYDTQIRNIGFFGNDRPKNELWWWLIPMILRDTVNKARKLSGLNTPPHPLRKDGGNGWFWIMESDATSYSYGTGCNSYWDDSNQINMLSYYWSGKYFRGEINGYFNSIDINTSFGETPEITNMDETKLANGIKYNLIEKTSDGYRWTILFFKEEQMRKLESLISDMTKELVNSFSDVIIKIDEIYKNTTPKHLYNQINGVLGASVHNINGIVYEILEENGTLVKPYGNECFTKQIVVIRK